MPMSSRPGLRWSIPVGVTALVLGGAVLGPALTASAEVELPERTPQQLLTDVQTADVDAFSGSVTQRAELGLPALPESLRHGGGTDVLSMLTGDHELRVWADGEKARVALHGRMGESDVVTDGTQVWAWSSEERTATRLVLPDDASGSERASRAEALAQAMPPVTPEALTTVVLDRLERSTAVSAGENVLVAGRPAYQLVLEPKAQASLVGSIRIAVDAGERVPTRVQVFADGASTPALEVGFTSLSFEAPDESVFRFTPPAGATVEEHTLEGGPDGLAPGALHRAGPDATPDASPGDTAPDAAPGAAVDEAEPGAGHDAGPRHGTVIGTGWDAVVVTRAPVALAGVDGDLGAFLQALPRVEGGWGSGRLLTSALFSALLTDDGRLLVGAVGRDTLLAAAGDPAADLG